MFFQKFLTVLVAGIVGAILLYVDFKATGFWKKGSSGAPFFGAVIAFLYAHIEWVRFDAKALDREVELGWWIAAATGPLGLWAWCFSTRGWKAFYNVAVSIPVYVAFPLTAYTFYIVTRS